jgi:hypothetical protein
MNANRRAQMMRDRPLTAPTINAMVDIYPISPNLNRLDNGSADLHYFIKFFIQLISGSLIMYQQLKVNIITLHAA